MKSANENRLEDNTGVVALILVIWVIIILISIVTEFSYSMRTEINIARNFKEEEEAYQLALAGIEYAKAEIRSIDDRRIVFVTEDGKLAFDQENLEPVRNKNLGRGSFAYTLTDEDGKMNINNAKREELKYVFLESDVDMEVVDELVDSIIDWRDKNDLHHLNGAEEDHYRGLDEPYSSKDGFFDSIEELLLVKGMTPEILYGSKAEAKDKFYDEDEFNGEDESNDEDESNGGVAKYFTVRGSGKININTAPSVVLEAVMGIAVADDIMLRREAGPLLSPTAKGKISSEFFTIISKGSNADGTIKRSVNSVVQNKKDNMEILYWNDNFIR